MSFRTDPIPTVAGVVVHPDICFASTVTDADVEFITDLLYRHESGDHGDVDPALRPYITEAVKSGTGPVVSRFYTERGTVIVLSGLVDGVSLHAQVLSERAYDAGPEACAAESPEFAAAQQAAAEHDAALFDTGHDVLQSVMDAASTIRTYIERIANLDADTDADEILRLREELKGYVKAQADDAEARLRKAWADEGVPLAVQDQRIAEAKTIANELADTIARKGAASWN